MDKELEKLRNDDVIWIIFILLSLLRLYADNCQRKCLIFDIKSYEERAKKIFLFVLIVTLIVYIYFLNNNYNDYINSYGRDRELNGVRLFGTFLLFIGTLILIYFNICNRNDLFEDNAL